MGQFVAFCFLEKSHKNKCHRKNATDFLRNSIGAGLVALFLKENPENKMPVNFGVFVLFLQKFNWEAAGPEKYATEFNSFFCGLFSENFPEKKNTA